MKKIFLFISVSISLSTFSQNKLIPETLFKFGRVSAPQLSPDEKEVIYGVTNYSIEENKGNRDIYKVATTGGTPTQLTNTKTSEQNAIWRPDGKKIGYISSEGGSSQIWEMDPDGNNKKQISNITGGVNEFKYAPNMQYVVYVQGVTVGKTVKSTYPDLTKANARIYDQLMFRHFDTFEDFEYNHPFTIAYNNGTITGEGLDLMKDEAFDCPMNPDGDISMIDISKDGRYIAYSSKKQAGTEYAITTNSDVYVYDTQTKTTKNISAEFKGYDRYPSFSPDGTKIFWRNMPEAGYESDIETIVIHDVASEKNEVHLTKDEKNYMDVSWSSDGKGIVLLAGINATYQLFKYDIAGKKLNKLTMGIHDMRELSTGKTFAVVSKNSMSAPAELYKIDLSNGKETQLTFVNKPVLDGIKMGKVEEKWITTSDEQKMLVWVIYPPDFDKTKKYPAILFCQGGPHGAVSQSFSYRWNFQLMAANGYIVVAPNRRGLATFGKTWNDQISGNWGGQNIQDYLSAIDSVSKESYVDKNRLGAVGASYGGYSIFYLAGNHNKRFKAFIAHAGIFNCESFYGSTEEIFFVNKEFTGAYWETKGQKKFYKLSSPHEFANKWDTPILITHGEKDYRVPVDQSYQAFTAAQLKGIPSKLVLLPEENHWIMKPQNSLVWQKEFFEWLDKWLKN